MSNKIDQPDHYQAQGMCVNDVIRAFDLNFALGNVLKYTLRAGRKHNESALDDLQKAVWYLRDEILSRSQDNDLEGLAARESSGEWGAVIRDEDSRVRIEQYLENEID